MSAPLAPVAASSPTEAVRPVRFRHRLEYVAAAAVLKLLGWLPNRIARAFCSVLAALSYWFWPRLRQVGLFNLRLAFPGWTERRRRQVVYRAFRNWGRMLADFAHFPQWSRRKIESVITYDGLEHYTRARDQGKGVLFLTAHFGNWELSSFAHGVYGNPLHFAVRPMDNPLLNTLVIRYRALSGGRPIEKNDFARQVLRALKQGEAVGVLMDTNMLLSEGVFVDFFGTPACTTSSPARLARKTGAALVLGLVIWDAERKKYRLRFEPVEWIERENPEEEILANTANFTRLIEDYIRRYPDQWLWVHRRWKTRPPGEPPLYR
ncbi:MAG TPA: lysophospholipid acyltransferase family protein [Candidatus Sulfopaludibacter sp.]|nr:lysophospholipid acyltransferase family protein [Terriglobia bacterium]HEV2447229.1 lysophospholipid acyltransferase family protein [Candidatus Sulfopaludibacter sp.]